MVDTPVLAVPARTRQTVDPGTLPGMSGVEFSTEVEADAPLVVDRTMWWGTRRRCAEVMRAANRVIAARLPSLVGTGRRGRPRRAGGR